MTDRAAAWCSECMSDSHDYPNCPKDEGTPPPDLSAQIRAKLNEMHHNAQRRGIDADEERDERLWRLSGDAELATAALIAVLDLHKPFELYHGDGDITYICGSCRFFTGEWPCPHLQEIGEKLGIEAVDA